jgi:hypothetical protein
MKVSGRTATPPDNIKSQVISNNVESLQHSILLLQIDALAESVSQRIASIHTDEHTSLESHETVPCSLGGSRLHTLPSAFQ